MIRAFFMPIVTLVREGIQMRHKPIKKSQNEIVYLSDKMHKTNMPVALPPLSQGRGTMLSKKVLGEDMFVVNPTMLASWGKRIALGKTVLGEDAVAIYSVLADDIL